MLRPSSRGPPRSGPRGRPSRPPGRGSEHPVRDAGPHGLRNMIVTFTLCPSDRNLSTFLVLVSKSPVPILGRYFISLMETLAALPGFPGLLGRLVLELPVVHDLADRRVGLRGHLHQIEIELLGHGQGLGERLDADLGPVRSDEPDFPGSDPVVDPRLGVVVVAVVGGRGRSYCRSLMRCVGPPPQGRLCPKRSTGVGEADARAAATMAAPSRNSTRTHTVTVAGWGPSLAFRLRSPL